MKRYAILIDGSNFFESLKSIRLRLDYMKLLTYFDGDVVRAMYFTALPEKDIESSIRPLLDKLVFNGWKVVTKPLQIYRDINGVEKIKGNMDLDMGVAAIEVSRFVSDIVLGTGDGDFVPVVNHIQKFYGVRVHCMTTRNLLNDSLHRECDSFIDLNRNEVREELEKNDG